MRANDFEINVHGLDLDGKLFSSRRIFEQQAVRINQYLKEWGVSGFTSPSMLRRPDWLHDLNITHTTSKFDIGPFESQPDPVETILPLWVQNGRSQKGFVELPYTLLQDHLLFVILLGKNIETWKRKTGA